MKLPLAVEAKVADELRTWLASELEQLNDASSTSQFAHHVVTILLHEDLDIEDEPLSSSGDDFLKDIFSMRQTKTREKQKKAAVEFLRSAVCCEDPVDANIQMVVEELMQKIDATKSKLQNRKLSKRSLLTPLAINVDTPVKRIGVKNGANEQLYNEAFPSLSGKDSPCKEAALVTSAAIVWNKSPGSGKENQKKRLRRRIGSRCTWLFRSPEEARACDIARETAAVVLEDLSFSTKEAMEVWAPSHINSTPFSDPPMFCWKSAFSKINFMTRPFSPSTAPLQFLHQSTEFVFSVKTIIPVILGDKAKKTYPECPHMDALSNWERMGFLPVSRKTNWKALRRPKLASMAPKEPLCSDGEVKFYLCPDEDKDGNQIEGEDCADLEVATFDEEIEGSASFPTHYGSYWQNLINGGAITLYPAFVAESEKKNSLTTIIWNTPSQDQQSSSNDTGIPGYQLQELTDRKPVEGNSISICEKNKTVEFCKISEMDLSSEKDLGLLMEEDMKEIFDMDIQDLNDSGYSVGASLMCSAENVVEADFEEAVKTSDKHCPPTISNDIAWDSPWHPTEWDDINQDILAGLMGTKRKACNPYLPPQLASCVTSEHSQFLQSAFVNAFFSSPHLDVFSKAWKPITHQKTCILQSLEDQQFTRPKIWPPPVELVKGCTCSNWLEDNCKLGLLCPFSHPSV